MKILRPLDAFRILEGALRSRMSIKPAREVAT